MKDMEWNGDIDYERHGMEWRQTLESYLRSPFSSSNWSIVMRNASPLLILSKMTGCTTVKWERCECLSRIPKSYVKPGSVYAKGNRVCRDRGIGLWNKSLGTLMAILDMYSTYNQ